MGATESSPCETLLNSREVVLVSSPDDLPAVLPDDKIIGFDCEWTTKCTTVCVLQLAFKDVCYVCQVVNWQVLPGCLVDVLSSPDTVLVGVGIDQDASRMLHTFGVACQPLVDLRSLVQMFYPHLSGRGLKILSQHLLKADISELKHKALTCSDWAHVPLRKEQIQYAALDAIVSLDLAYFLYNKSVDSQTGTLRNAVNFAHSCAVNPLRLLLRTVTPVVGSRGGCPRAKSLRDIQRLTDTIMMTSCITAKPKQRQKFSAWLAESLATTHRKCVQRYRDQHPDNAQNTISTYLLNYSGKFHGLSMPTGNDGRPGLAGAVRVNTADRSGKATVTYRRACKQGQHYHNIVIQAVDGTPLSGCDQKKAEWYLSKGLAEIIEEEPRLVIRLNFQPQVQRGEAGLEFRTGDHQDICVICGRDKSLIKHSIVPNAYLRHLSLERFNHFYSHDVVLVCATCKPRADSNTFNHKLRLAAMHQAPINGLGEPKIVNNELRDVVVVAGALQRHKLCQAAETKKTGKRAINLPPERIAEFRAKLAVHFGTNDFTDEDIEELATTVWREPNPDFKSHEELVCTSVGDSGPAIGNFIRDWRETFIRVLKPQHLPQGWSVEFNLSNFHENGGKGTRRKYSD
eukprot:TRINITY_DN22_c0_g1_i1.p1 TRINITY_DN22_c0_g1~~TRINITY_DN22_c0_g1_i1.p1  ORF type:complete len:650 (-),score=22.26 TRINITY_DN22_c0_g1_i1:133-2013(-)